MPAGRVPDRPAGRAARAPAGCRSTAWWRATNVQRRHRRDGPRLPARVQPAAGLVGGRQDSVPPAPAPRPSTLGSPSRWLRGMAAPHGRGAGRNGDRPRIPGRSNLPVKVVGICFARVTYRLVLRDPCPLSDDHWYGGCSCQAVMTKYACLTLLREPLSGPERYMRVLAAALVTAGAGPARACPPAQIWSPGRRWSAGKPRRRRACA